MHPDSHRASSASTSSSTSATAAMPTSHSKRTLAEEISLACGKYHTALNERIMRFFPRGVPPQARDPTQFGHGLAVFCGTPYMTFERAFRSLSAQSNAPAPLDASFSPSDSDSDEEMHDESSRSKHRREVHALLTHLVPPTLYRSERLARDMQWFNIDPSRAPDAGTAEEAYAAHIRSSTTKSPVLLVAYAWTMYMAIFAGGRYIRAELAKYPDEWWDALRRKDNLLEHELLDEHKDVRASDERLDRPGFSFLSFDGPGDGEEALAKFKEGMSRADRILTKKERKAVVKEAQKIFEYGIRMVEELDAGNPGLAHMGMQSGDAVIDVESVAAASATTPLLSEKLGVPVSAPVRGDLVDRLEAQEAARTEARELRNFIIFRRAEVAQRRVAWYLWVRFAFWTTLVGYGYVVSRWYSGKPMW